jgi:glycosyltransferase involved in cell wall biosynthesis
MPEPLEPAFSTFVRMSKTVFYSYHARTSFIRIDESILERRFRIQPFVFSISGGLSIPLLWLKQARSIWRHRREIDLFFSMFAGYHTLVPCLFARWFKKPHIIVAGGIDCVSYPSADYGNFHKPLLARITAFSFRTCSFIAPISEYLVRSENQYAAGDPVGQGILNMVPNLRTPIKVVHNGFWLDRWYPDAEPRKVGTFITIASNLDHPSRVRIKGIDLVLQVAALCPQFHFTIIGKDAPEGFTQLSNVTVLPFQPYESLRQVYCRHSHYLQLSMSEGFGNTLAESMLCGCVPVGSRAGAIPMIVGDAGYLLDRKDAAQLKGLLELAVAEYSMEQGMASRQRILQQFGIDRRQDALMEVINGLLPAEANRT